MSKKYSVKIENETIESIEVDGVQYDSPDQIPDETDREKVLELISNMMNKDFDREFEEKLEADFRELEKQAAQLPSIITTVFLIIAVIMLIIASISTVNTVRKLTREESAPGQIVDMVAREYHDSEINVTSEYFYPVVSFKLPDGTQKRVQLSEGSWPPDYEVGEQVTVLYDPTHPLDARIKSTSSTILLWILPGITGILGLTFLGATVIVHKFFGPSPTETKTQ